MPAPLILSTSPSPNSTDVVLGMPIQVVFDQAMDSATVDEKTFSLTGPGQTSQIDADESIRTPLTVRTGREYILGTFSWTDPQTLLFTPNSPLRPEVTYEVLIVGGDSILSTVTVKSALAVSLAHSYRFSFTTGALNLPTPPAASPLSPIAPRFSVNDIQVIPRRSIQNNLLEEIELWFPADIDMSSLDPSLSGGDADFNPFNDIIVSLDALLDDPQIVIPPNSTFSIQISGRVMKIRMIFPEV